MTPAPWPTYNACLSEVTRRATCQRQTEDQAGLTSTCRFKPKTQHPLRNLHTNILLNSSLAARRVKWTTQVHTPPKVDQLSLSANTWGESSDAPAGVKKSTCVSVKRDGFQLSIKMPSIYQLELQRNIFRENWKWGWGQENRMHTASWLLPRKTMGTKLDTLSI